MSLNTTFEFGETEPSLQIEQEKFLLGYVDGYTKLDPEDLDLNKQLEPQAIWRVDIDDPYVSSRPAAEQMEVRNAEVEADNYAFLRRLDGTWERKPGTAYVTDQGEEEQKTKWGDPESRNRFFSSLGSPAIALWQEDLIPSAKALAYLSDPTGFKTVESADGERSVPVDDLAEKWFSLCTDAIGIRSRATVLSEAIKDFMNSKQNMGCNINDLRWMSVACGTALPTLKAAVAAKASPDLLLVDWDVDAMNSTHKLADELGFEGSIDKKRVNIFSDKDMSKLKDELAAQDKLPELIDLMGIFEYTGENIGVDPARFLRNSYDFLKPGGRLIFGQMRSDRPLSDFTMGVVSWPFIHMRSAAETMGIIRDAGILPEQTRLFMPQDGVYMVGVIDKPTLD